MEQGINIAYLYDVTRWVVLSGCCMVLIGCFIGLVGLRVIGSKLIPEVAIEWLQRWVALTRLERWTILWSYVRMDKTEREIFRRLWIELDCRIYTEFGGVQNLLLSMFGGTWVIGEMARAIPHQGWMTGIPRPAAMPITERPTTFVQILANDSAKKIFTLGLLLALIGMAARILLRRI